MNTIDNGGAYAIRGFNYQKSVVALIAILHYLHSDPDFEIYVESKDDIVVKVRGEETFIQAKNKELSILSVTRKDKNNNTILGKNLANGNEKSSRYKLVAPAIDSLADLEETSARILTKGAAVYTFSDDAVDLIEKRVPGISKVKLRNASIAITKFGKEYEEAIRYIMGVMVEQEIPVDNSHGKAALEELFNQIDIRSAHIVKSDEDFEKKRFTLEDLSTVISHTYKLEYIEDTLKGLGYNTAKKEAIKTERRKIASLFDSQFREAKSHIEGMPNLTDLPESEVVKSVLAIESIKKIDEKLTREAIAIDAYCQVIFERKRK